MRNARRNLCSICDTLHKYKERIGITISVITIVCTITLVYEYFPWRGTDAGGSAGGVSAGGASANGSYVPIYEGGRSTPSVIGKLSKIAAFGNSA